MTPDGRDKNIDTVLSLFDLKIEVTERDVDDAIGKSEANRTILQMRSIGLVEIFQNIGSMSLMLKFCWSRLSFVDTHLTRAPRLATTT
jgi:hypothetical protein